jgi:hypothetical protein
MYKRNNDNKESLLIGAQKRAKINCKLARWGRYQKSARVRGNGVSAINISRFWPIPAEENQRDVKFTRISIGIAAVCVACIYFGITGAPGSPAARTKPFLRVRGRSLSALCICVKEYARAESSSRGDFQGHQKWVPLSDQWDQDRRASPTNRKMHTSIYLYHFLHTARIYPSQRAPPRESQRPADRLLCTCTHKQAVIITLRMLRWVYIQSFSERSELAKKTFCCHVLKNVPLNGFIMAVYLCPRGMRIEFWTWALGIVLWPSSTEQP